MIDYFKPPVIAEEEMIRRIKGNYRRHFVSHAIQDEGVDSIPEPWKVHEIFRSA